MLLQEKNGLLQIIIGGICAFPEQNHIIAFKTPKTNSFLRRHSCSTMVEYRLTEQMIRVQSSPKSDFLVPFRVVGADTGNK